MNKKRKESIKAGLIEFKDECLNSVVSVMTELARGLVVIFVCILFTLIMTQT